MNLDSIRSPLKGMLKMRKPDGRGILYGIGAFLLEATGVASGAYCYGDFPLKILGVPLFIPIMWTLIAYFAYIMFESYGSIGLLIAYCIDLILEPLAYHTGLWTWLNPYSTQIYFGSTIANALVWMGMCLIGVILFRWRKA